MSELIVDFIDKCRLCLSDLNVESQAIEIDQVLSEQLEELIGFFNTSELLPGRACAECQTQLDDFYRFKCQVSENQFTLDELLKNSQAAEIKADELNYCFEEYLLDDDDDDDLKGKLTGDPKRCPSNRGQSDRCSICDKQFKDRRNIPLHIQRVHERLKNHKCDKCDYRCYKKFDMMLHHRNIHLKDSHQDNKVLCPECGKTMRNNSDLRRHQQKQHLMIKRYKCDSCDFASFERSTMITHGRTHMSPDDRDLFPCEICGKVLSTRNTLKFHISSVHDDIRSFNCSMCSKTFAQKGGLQRHHKAVHQGTTDYQCDICKVFVSQACYLRKHKQLMHPIDGIKIKYPCDICHQNFSTEQAMRNHQRIHRDPEFECSCCLKKFHRKVNLLDHMEHHETLEFPCEHCKRSFRKEAQLKTHLKRVHFKESTTFACELCSSTFTRRTTYRDHILKKHKELKKVVALNGLKKNSKLIPKEKN